MTAITPALIARLMELCAKVAKAHDKDCELTGLCGHAIATAIESRNGGK